MNASIKSSLFLSVVNSSAPVAAAIGSVVGGMFAALVIAIVTIITITVYCIYKKKHSPKGKCFNQFVL